MEHAVTFPVDDIVLEGLVSLAEPVPNVAAVICHPHPLRGGNMRNNVVAALVETLQNHGVSTLRFNFRGTGHSGATHDDGNAERADVLAAMEYLSQQQPGASLIVLGYSFGAGVGLQAAAADTRVQALIGVGVPVARLEAGLLEYCPKAKLFILGDRDHVCPLPAMQELAARCVPPTHVAVLPGADHFFWDREGEVAQAAMAFLKEHCQS